MLVLADFAPLSPSAQLALESLLGIALALVLIWAAVRRQPPLDAELVKLKSAIDSLKESVDSLKDTAEKVASHASEIAELRQKVRTLEDHREKDLTAQRTYTRETTREIFVAIDHFKASFALNVQQIERAIGKLEGSFTGIDDRVTRIERAEAHA